MSETTALIKCLKRRLKEHGITYAEIAKPLELSEASVKRLFSEENISLKRMEVICRYVGISFSDLAIMLERERNYISQLTDEQERELLSDDRLVLVCQLVFSDWQFEDILRIFTLKKPELIKLLVKLNNIGLIELLPNNRFKLLTAKNFSWRKDGPVQSFFKNTIQNDFFQSDFTAPTERLNLLTGMLSAEAYQRFSKKLEELMRDFDLLCTEDSARPLTDRHGYAVVLATRPWNLSLFKEYVKDK